MKGPAFFIAATTFALIGGLAAAAKAQTEFDQDVTPDVIFGAGNANGGFTTDRRDGVEIGLRGKLRFDGSCAPQNIFNSNGDGTYSFAAGAAEDAGTMTPCAGADTPVWSFDWSVNTDYDGTSGLVLDDLTYELGLDGDPGLATDFLVFDNISPSIMTPFWDHAIGDNTTGNGGGTVAVDAADYEDLIAAENVAQNSWRYDFFNGVGTALQDFDPALDGTYAIYLLARDAEGAVVARSDIQILIGDATPAGPQLACRGFEPPLNEAVTVPNAGRALPLRLHLADAFGLPLSDAEIQANPVAQISYAGVFGDANPDLGTLKTAGRGAAGNQLVFKGGNWALNLQTQGLVPGEYTITVVSGNLAEYVIAPTCEVVVTIL